MLSFFNSKIKGIQVIKFEVIQKIKIENISEDVVRKLILAEIQKQVPEAHINSIKFVMKRNPTSCMEVEVDAQYGAPKPSEILKEEIKEAFERADEPTTSLTDAVLEPVKKIAALLIDPIEKVIEDVVGKPEPKKETKAATTNAGDVANMFKIQL